MIDVTSFTLGGIQLIALVFGLTEFIKSAFKMNGAQVTVMAALLGAVIFALYQLTTFLPEPYGQIVTAVFASIAFGLSASGYYKFFNARFPSQDKVLDTTELSDRVG